MEPERQVKQRLYSPLEEVMASRLDNHAQVHLGRKLDSLGDVLLRGDINDIRGRVAQLAFRSRCIAGGGRRASLVDRVIVSNGLMSLVAGVVEERITQFVTERRVVGRSLITRLHDRGGPDQLASNRCVELVPFVFSWPAGLVWGLFARNSGMN